MPRLQAPLVESSGASGGKRIKEVVFGLLSPEEMESLAEFECTNRELYTMPSRKPAPNGCLDLRLGAANKQTACATCHKKVDQRARGVGEKNGPRSASLPREGDRVVRLVGARATLASCGWSCRSSTWGTSSTS